jgi:hypothetical protein
MGGPPPERTATHMLCFASEASPATPKSAPSVAKSSGFPKQELNAKRGSEMRGEFLAMRFSPALLSFSRPDTGPKSRTIFPTQPIVGSRVQIQPAPPSSPQVFGPLGESIEIRPFARNLGLTHGPGERLQRRQSGEYGKPYPPSSLIGPWMFAHTSHSSIDRS